MACRSYLVFILRESKNDRCLKFHFSLDHICNVEYRLGYNVFTSFFDSRAMQNISIVISFSLIKDNIQTLMEIENTSGQILAVLVSEHGCYISYS